MRFRKRPEVHRNQARIPSWVSFLLRSHLADLKDVGHPSSNRRADASPATRPPKRQGPNCTTFQLCFDFCSYRIHVPSFNTHYGCLFLQTRCDVLFNPVWNHAKFGWSILELFLGYHSIPELLQAEIPTMYAQRPIVARHMRSALCESIWLECDNVDFPIKIIFLDHPFTDALSLSANHHLTIQCLTIKSNFASCCRHPYHCNFSSHFLIADILDDRTSTTCRKLLHFPSLHHHD